MHLRGIIFDLDGTLADTIPICIEAFRRTLKAHSGPSLSPAEIKSLFGPTEEGMLQQVLPRYSPAALETYLSEYECLHTTSTVPFNGLSTLLRTLQNLGIKLAIVTGKGPRSANISCRALGLRDYFTHLEAGSPTGIIKHEALARVVGTWVLPKTDVAYVGDAPADIEAARSAGIISVAAAWASGANVELLEAASPDFLFLAVADFASWAINVAGNHGSARGR